MPSAIGIFFLGFALFSSCSAHVYKRLSCEEFSKGSNFSSSQAEGDWYLLAREPPKNPRDIQCAHFSAVSDQERQELKAKIGQYANDLNWQNVVLKMQTPCAGGAGSDLIRHYYLEKLGDEGSYNALLMPPPSAKVVSNYYNQRHEMRLKLVDGRFLALMDCVEQFTFVMDKKRQETELSPALITLLHPYLPLEY